MTFEPSTLFHVYTIHGERQPDVASYGELSTAIELEPSLGCPVTLCLHLQSAAAETARTRFAAPWDIYARYLQSSGGSPLHRVHLVLVRWLLISLRVLANLTPGNDWREQTREEIDCDDSKLLCDRHKGLDNNGGLGIGH